MCRIIIAAAIGVLVALPAVELIAAESQPGAMQPGQAQPPATSERKLPPKKDGTKAPSSGTVAPFKCDTAKRTCTCKGARDCYNMGAADVCRSSMWDVNGTMTCDMKQ